MKQTFTDLLDNVISDSSAFNTIWFAGDDVPPPEASYQVNFPRLELVFNGQYENLLESPQHQIENILLRPGDALFIPPNAWNKPSWDKECSVLSLLFGKSQLGFSLVSKHDNEEGFYDVVKYSVPQRTGRAIDHILTALSTLAYEKQKQPADKFLLLALLSYCKDMLTLPTEDTSRRGEDMFKGICIYVQENFHRNINRNTVAARFNISPNHLSRLFRQEGHMRFADYISWVRLERAKFMLKRYNFRLEEVAQRCGYHDPNYFCRVFKRKTGKTPTEYRSR
ncbi:AraC family transcriptional regulator [Photobacterium gaetbulicola]|uniref:Putative transcriptional regulator n=1 Tax=Photobacterium gaetbulicola Gung47 TaxID=658445 RepID=A0A0C5WFY6_9GAMM|nr:AraC family transcriptional regulator [Photobacterium gaetbulicola]AJR05102.1 putative transcriptional regulator [Photobacterium gaetbulicola Gung47]PSU06871.1 AraC family transcriptional regulator [Photobacterium gaetbulicola]